MHEPADPDVSLDRSPCRTVILRHELLDGSFHFDWMFQPPAGFPRCSQAGSFGLTTFRCAMRPDEIEPGIPHVIHRIADHREAYLDHQGAISGDRGFVKRLRSGEIVGCSLPSAEDKPAFRLQIKWAGGDLNHDWQEIRLVPGIDHEWTMVCARQNPVHVAH